MRRVLSSRTATNIVPTIAQQVNLKESLKLSNRSCWIRQSVQQYKHTNEIFLQVRQEANQASHNQAQREFFVKTKW